MRRFAEQGSRAAAVAVLALAATATGAALAARTTAHSLPARPSWPACQSRVASRVLPSWARTGFSDPLPRMPYLVGTNGDIVAILWASPLLSPPATDRNNKILWVSRVPSTPGADLLIDAQRVVGSTPVGKPVRRRVERGPGPSIVDLPHAGCYHVSLRWSGHTDALSLEYVARR